MNCKRCGKDMPERYESGRKRNPNTMYCVGHHPIHSYAGKKHYNWKGGRHYDSRGYALVNIGPGKRRPEQDIIMEIHLGRKLDKNEVVHHKNGIKDDNRIENLELLTRKSHPLEHVKRDVVTGRFIT